MDATSVTKRIEEQIPVTRVKIYPRCPKCGREWALDFVLWKMKEIADEALICRNCGYNPADQIQKGGVIATDL